ncbi:crossover junction endodeoxyribonuclease RuvC [Pseudoclavibacter soli]|uniref:crossover junction endodeoxyribonuclease RuvC n=1 Tax=Pseudoclavibacter soli TaxID=452623 RepID=UPI0003F9F4E0
MSVILGIDPGLTRCGFGVVQATTRRRLSLVEVGVIRSSPQEEISRRVHRIAAELRTIIERHQPGVITVERVFAQQNLPSVMGVAHIIGAAMLLAGDYGIPLTMHTPTEVKAAVTGSGRADKPQVQHMVARLLSIDEVGGPPDAADALAVAVCEAFKPSAQVSAARPGVAETPAQRAWRQARAAAGDVSGRH